MELNSNKSLPVSSIPRGLEAPHVIKASQTDQNGRSIPKPGEAENRKKKNIERKIKERKIRQLHLLNDYIKEPPKFKTHYVLKFPGIDIERELNTIRANRELLQILGNPVKISKINKNSILIIIQKQTQADRITTITEIASNPVTIEPHRTLNNVKGTVFSETLAQSTDEEILEQLEPQGVEKVERMKRKEGNILINTNRFILTFKGTHLPSLIAINDWQKEIVQTYIPRPLRCTRCQRLGHTKKWCRHGEEDDHCARCSQKGHKIAECQNEPYCINCRGPHPPTSLECTDYKFRCEVIATQARNHVTRNEAIEQVRINFRRDQPTYSSVVKNTTAQPSNEANTPAANTINLRPIPKEDPPRTFSNVVDLPIDLEEEPLPDIDATPFNEPSSSATSSARPSPRKPKSPQKQRPSEKKSEASSLQLLANYNSNEEDSSIQPQPTGNKRGRGPEGNSSPKDTLKKTRTTTEAAIKLTPRKHPGSSTSQGKHVPQRLQRIPSVLDTKNVKISNSRENENIRHSSKIPTKPPGK
mgnify:CR=1 FL=1